MSLAPTLLVMAILLALLVIVPLLELWVIIEIGSVIGALPTIMLLLAFSFCGALLVRREGRSAWQKLTNRINSGQIPAKETADGALVVLAGALLLTPGFLTDLCGLLLLLPAVRGLIRSFGLARIAGGGWRGLAFSAASSAGGRYKPRSKVRTDYDAEGVVVESDPPALDR